MELLLVVLYVGFWRVCRWIAEWVLFIFAYLLILLNYAGPNCYYRYNYGQGLCDRYMVDSTVLLLSLAVVIIVIELILLGFQLAKRWKQVVNLVNKTLK